MYLMHFIYNLLPSHQQLRFCLSFIPGAEPEVSSVEFDPGQGGHMVTGVEHLGGLGQQVLQPHHIVPGLADGGDKVVIELPDGISSLNITTITAHPLCRPIHGVTRQHKTLSSKI